MNAPVVDHLRTTSAPTISVVICVYTRDRWNDILAAVDSVRYQTVTPHEIVVVVDHNPALYAELTTALPDVTVVENRRQRGLSGGKDTAYADPAVAGVGGTTLPLWSTTRPRWFPTEFDWVLGCTFTGREPGRVRNLLGGNASFRREVFTVAGGFPQHIGRTSADQRPLGCEETEFCIRVSQRRPDWAFVFEPQAVIWHRVTPERERFSYFRARCFAEGLSKAAVTRSVGMADGLAAERRYTTKTLTRGIAREFGGVFRGDRAGLERSYAISVGLLSAAAGYARAGIPVRRHPVGVSPR
jgi:glucosyl-dolichyl phosphate glucuronosyltransferase